MSKEQGTLINRVANSGIEVINLENYFPKANLVSFDLKDFLFHGLILKEKEFRSKLKEYDWSTYKDKITLVYCSADAIIPMWAYMLVASYLEEVKSEMFQGSRDEYLKLHYTQVLNALDLTDYAEKRVVIKGCGEKDVPALAYAKITELLRPYAQSIMYGEPCSTVPIFKRPRKF